MQMSKDPGFCLLVEAYFGTQKYYHTYSHVSLIVYNVHPRASKRLVKTMYLSICVRCSHILPMLCCRLPRAKRNHFTVSDFAWFLLRCSSQLRVEKQNASWLVSLTSCDCAFGRTGHPHTPYQGVVTLSRARLWLPVGRCMLYSCPEVKCKKIITGSGGDIFCFIFVYLKFLPISTACRSWTKQMAFVETARRANRKRNRKLLWKEASGCTRSISAKTRDEPAEGPDAACQNTGRVYHLSR